MRRDVSAPGPSLYQRAGDPPQRTVEAARRDRPSSKRLALIVRHNPRRRLPRHVRGFFFLREAARRSGELLSKGWGRRRRDESNCTRRLPRRRILLSYAAISVSKWRIERLPKTHFAFGVDFWDDRGDSIVEYVASRPARGCLRRLLRPCRRRRAVRWSSSAWKSASALW
jgi:hypothetical protein